MRFIVGILLFIGAVFFAYPLVQEDIGSECRALERRIIALASPTAGDAAALAALQTLSGGSLAMTAAKEKYPDLPPAVGCSIAYWQTVFDPDVVKRARIFGGPTSAGRPAIDETIRTVSPAIEAEKARRALTNPTPPTPVESQPPAGPSYRPADRQGMDRLIGTQR